MKKVFLFLALLFIPAIVYGFFTMQTPQSLSQAVSYTRHIPSPPLSPSPAPLPKKKVLQNNYHIFQSFNNCGPASLSMGLSYFSIHKSQEELGQSLRPYQNPQGDNDDKSVTFAEMAKEAQTYGLLTYHRPNGDIELVKQFLAHDIPVLTRTWLHVNEDIGHYRVVKGYDDETKQLLQDDSFENKNLWFSYNDFNTMWEKFDYEYLVLVPKEKKQLAENILGNNLKTRYAWEEAIKKNKKQLADNPSNIYATFNLSIAYYYTGDYQKSIDAFEKVQQALPARTLWYQIEPLLSYYEIHQDDKLFAITESILNNNNRAFSELYLLRGKTYQRKNQQELAKQEFEKAVYYNSNLQEAKDALNSLSL